MVLQIGRASDARVHAAQLATTGDLAELLHGAWSRTAKSLFERRKRRHLLSENLYRIGAGDLDLRSRRFGPSEDSRRALKPPGRSFRCARATRERYHSDSDHDARCRSDE